MSRDTEFTNETIEKKHRSKDYIYIYICIYTPTLHKSRNTNQWPSKFPMSVHFWGLHGNTVNV